MDKYKRKLNTGKESLKSKIWNIELLITEMQEQLALMEEKLENSEDLHAIVEAEYFGDHINLPKNVELTSNEATYSEGHYLCYTIRTKNGIEPTTPGNYIVYEENGDVSQWSERDFKEQHEIVFDEPEKEKVKPKLNNFPYGDDLCSCCNAYITRSYKFCKCCGVEIDWE